MIRARHHVAGIGMVKQIDSKRLDAVRPDQLHGFGLEPRQLQDRDLDGIVHQIRVYRNAA